MLVYPVFIREGKNIIEDIPAMPGQKRYSPDTFPKFLEETANAGIKSILLFGLPEHKDERGSGAWDENGVIQQALRVGKKNFPEMTFICDVCLCEYTSHGHCGLLRGETGRQRPDRRAAREDRALAGSGRSRRRRPVGHDGRARRRNTRSARRGWNGRNYNILLRRQVRLGLLRPFREAAGSTPAFGDRRSYQMDPRNVREALREAELDIEEGADMIMVKPGLPYLDVLSKVKEAFDVPTGAYCVSGEYSMSKGRCGERLARRGARRRGERRLPRARWR